MQEIWMILSTMSINDVLDIMLVAIPFYVIFTLLREARSMLALWGLILSLIGVLTIYLVAKIFALEATALIYERFWIIVVLLFLIVFQSELKKALADIGRLRIFRSLFTEQTHVIDEIVAAVADLARRHVGSLIVFERNNTLTKYMSQGTILDANISSEMIRAIFATPSPLHDGALIVRGSRLVAGSCILPLSENVNIAKDLGTRHRAAIGLTEETDAVVVVVSEETGTISLCENGQIERHLDADDLRTRLADKLNLRGELEPAGARGAGSGMA